MCWGDCGGGGGGGGLTQAGQTGRQTVEGGKWREKEGKESKKELHCLVLI